MSQHLKPSQCGNVWGVVGDCVYAKVVLFHACSLFPPLGGKVLRHTELNTDIVTWTRLLNRAAPSSGPHIDTTASPMAIGTQEAKSKQNSGHDSPPSSPLTSHSGGSTPKSPNTPNDLEKDDSPPMNGELPPPIPIREDDLAPSSRINDHPIIPPPREFLGSMEDIARRRASEGCIIQPPPSMGGVSHGGSPYHMYPEASNTTSPSRHIYHQSPQHMVRGVRYLGIAVLGMSCA